MTTPFLQTCASLESCNCSSVSKVSAQSGAAMRRILHTPQSKGLPVRTVSSPIWEEERTAGFECEECGSKNSAVAGTCQICGHESLLLERLAARFALVCGAKPGKGLLKRASSLNFSCSSRAQSVHRSSARYDYCPDCKSHGSIHLGSCQVCGFTFNSRVCKVFSLNYSCATSPLTDCSCASPVKTRSLYLLSNESWRSDRC